MNVTKAQAERAARLINKANQATGCRAAKQESGWVVITDEAGVDALTASYDLGDQIPGVWGEPINSAVLALWLA